MARNQEMATNQQKSKSQQMSKKPPGPPDRVSGLPRGAGSLFSGEAAPGRSPPQSTPGDAPWVNVAYYSSITAGADLVTKKSFTASMICRRNPKRRTAN
ncbi:hypothetical protein PCANC_25918 [Puccinia coronata f. sp. avenae]|uniref:Uncharacterized protein n=1 Tax=Puccinia coronata f. sp. avenae TaxID=200324 RepID=A0A2N5TJP2_9BASI|nr:hypothetical protein PCANC_25918 [Puccinia coronata f. sp. avenae]